MEALLDEIDLARTLVTASPLLELAGEEFRPGRGVRTREALREVVLAT